MMVLPVESQETGAYKRAAATKGIDMLTRSDVHVDTIRLICSHDSIEMYTRSDR